MPTPDPAAWLLTYEEIKRIGERELDIRSDRYKAVARAQLLKAMKGVEEWLDQMAQTERRIADFIAAQGGYSLGSEETFVRLTKASTELAAARARLESEGR